MIYGKPIGRLVLTVCDPSPAWLRIGCGTAEFSLHPDELSDLEHLCRVAREELERMRASGIWGATL